MHAEIARHRRYQLILSLMTLSALIVGFHPHYSYLAVWVGVITNLVWIWE